jgi:hypothetical protein
MPTAAYSRQVEREGRDQVEEVSQPEQPASGARNQGQVSNRVNLCFPTLAAMKLRQGWGTPQWCENKRSKNQDLKLICL